MIGFRRTSSYSFSASKDDSLEPAALHRSATFTPEEDLRSTVIGAGDFTFSWRHITALVQQKRKWWDLQRTERKVITKTLLDNVSGAISSGEMLVIIGRHNAGKTLLLKLLSGKKIPNVEVSGQQLLNCENIQSEMRKYIAYLPEEDLFFGTLTVEEHLTYQAHLTMGSALSMEVKMAKISLILSELGLTSCSKTVIGIPGLLSGLTREQLKKLSLASQLILDARIILCDEPTTKLDPSEGYHVAAALQKIAVASKRIVICTLRRPSSEIFYMFNYILVLYRGRTVFFGHKEEALNFLENLNLPCPEQRNPTDHFMYLLEEMLRENKEQNIYDLCNQYLGSSYSERYTMNSFRVTESSFEETPIDHSKENLSIGLWFSFFYTYLCRSHICMSRDPMLTTMQISYGFSGIFFLCLMFWGHELNQARTTAINAVLFVLLISLTVSNIVTVIPSLCRDISIFMFEHGHSMFHSTAFYLARSMTESYAIFALPAIFTTALYWCVGFLQDPKAYSFCVGVMFLNVNIAISFAHFMSCLLKRSTSANVVAVFICIIFGIYGGFLLSDHAMPPFFYWLKHLSWLWNCYEVMIINQWITVEEIECELYNTSLCMTNGEQVMECYGIHPHDVMEDIDRLVIWFVIYRVLSLTMFLIRIYLRSWDMDILHFAG